jgi:hypothetical protein
MRTLTDSELDAVAGGASLAVNAPTGFSVLAPATVTANPGQTLATAGTVLSPLAAGQIASFVFTFP